MDCFRIKRVPFWVTNFEIGKMYCVSQTVDSNIIKDELCKILFQEAVKNKKYLLYLLYDYVDYENYEQFSCYPEYNELVNGYDIILPYDNDGNNLYCLFANLHSDTLSDELRQIICFVENDGLELVEKSLCLNCNNDDNNVCAVAYSNNIENNICPIVNKENVSNEFYHKCRNILKVFGQSIVGFFSPNSYGATCGVIHSSDFVNQSPRNAERNRLRTEFYDRLKTMGKSEMKELLLQSFERMPPSERKRFLVDVSMYKTDTKVIIRKENYKTNKKANYAFYIECDKKRSKVLFNTAAQNVLYLHCLLNLCNNHYCKNTDKYDEQRSAKIFKLLYESRKYPDPDLGPQKLSILTSNINNQLVNSTVLLKGHNVKPLMIRNMSVVADIENVKFENTSFSELQQALQQINTY